MKVEKKGSCAAFRVADGHVIPNHGQVKLSGKGTLNASPIKMQSKVAEVTKPLAAVNEIVVSGSIVILHKTGGIVKKPIHAAEKAIRDIIKKEPGPEVVL